jgi:CBS-domain-containing membrane protein
MLAEHDILGAPVLDEKSVFLGFVDVLDITGFTLSRYHLDSEKLRSPSFAEDHFFHTPIKEVINFSKVDDSAVISADATVHDLVQLLTKSRVHRVAVGDKHR